MYIMTQFQKSDKNLSADYSKVLIGMQIAVWGLIGSDLLGIHVSFLREFIVSLHNIVPRFYYLN